MTGERYTVSEPVRLDRLARAIYGRETDGTVEDLLEANPGLAAGGAVIPAGTELVLPQTVETTAATTVRPWD
ncbi:MAG TPA: tail protein X [Aurantimonas sp.]|jgi:phage tail protein X|nr:tail protein X [Aurantimonas sp.]